MKHSRLSFPSLAEAVCALQRIRQAMILVRFEAEQGQSVVVAVNAAAAAIPAMPAPGEHPDARRDRKVTPDVELEYLYAQLIERGRARQVLSLDGGDLYELTVRRVRIGDDDRVYGLVFAVLKKPAEVNQRRPEF